MNDEALILWDLDLVVDWFWRNDAYARFRARANAGCPTISAQTLGEFVRILRLRPSTAAKMEQALAEIREHFLILVLDAERAIAYGEVVDACRNTPDLDVRGEAWFVWQVALHRREGCRVATKSPARYRGLVGPGGLV